MIPAGVRVLVATSRSISERDPTACWRWCATGADPFNGSLYVFRAKRADRIKIVWWDGSGVCALCKAARGLEVLLAADRAAPGSAKSCAIARPGRRTGLEKGPPGGGEAAAIGGLTRLWQSESDPGNGEETGREHGLIALMDEPRFPSSRRHRRAQGDDRCHGGRAAAAENAQRPVGGAQQRSGSEQHPPAKRSTRRPLSALQG